MASSAQHGRQEDDMFPPARTGSAARRGERAGEGNTASERSWDDGGRSAGQNYGSGQDSNRSGSAGHEDEEDSES